MLHSHTYLYIIQTLVMHAMLVEHIEIRYQFEEVKKIKMFNSFRNHLNQFK